MAVRKLKAGRKLMAGRKRRRGVLIGVAVFVVFVVAVTVALTAQNGLPGSTKSTVMVAFNNVGSLRVGDDVRVAGVRVGRVAGISLSGNRAVVQLNLDSISRIYRNATVTTASVGARSALGEKYVDLNPGSPSAGVIPPGQLVPATDTTGAQDITDLLDVFDAQTRSALGSLLLQTGGGANGHAPDISAAVRSLPTELPDLAAISEALSANGGASTSQLLGAVDSFAANFTGRQQQLTQLLGQLDTTLRAVAVDNGAPLRQAVDQAPQTLQQVKGALAALNGPLANTGSAMANLRAGAVALGQATPDVRGVLTGAVPPLTKLPGVANLATPAISDLTQVFADARPLAPRLASTLANAAGPLAYLAPYAPEMAQAFTTMRGALAEGDASGHWLTFMVEPTTEAALGVVPGLTDPLIARDAYPAPGQAGRDRTTGPLGTKGN